jgi:NAD(P)H-dependent FMN reductase
MIEIVCVSGTSRPDNYTSRALAVVAAALEESGHSVTLFDGRALELGFPGSGSTDDARRLREAISEAAGVVLATPEYHGTFSAYTKLVIENLGFPSALAGKPVALLGVAAGRIGAIKSLEHLKGVCSHVGALVVPGSVSIAGIKNVFADGGELSDDAAHKALAGLADSLTNFMKDYVCPRVAMESLVRDGEASWTTTV